MRQPHPISAALIVAAAIVAAYWLIWAGGLVHERYLLRQQNMEMDQRMNAAVERLDRSK